MNKIREKIEAAWEDRSLLEKKSYKKAVRKLIDFLDKGEIRVATPSDAGWVVNDWVKKGVILYFPIQK